MRQKITVLIDGSSKVINLQESLMVTHDNPFVLVKKATIFWNFDNISSSNNKLTYNSVEKTIEPVYWTARWETKFSWAIIFLTKLSLLDIFYAKEGD